MKYCPYCGARLPDAESTFCSECGRNILAAADENRNHRLKRFLPKLPIRKRSKTEKSLPAEGSQQAADNAATGERAEQDYDGYYDDILPADAGSKREPADCTLVIKVAALIAGVLLIIAVCAVALYLL